MFFRFKNQQFRFIAMFSWVISYSFIGKLVIKIIAGVIVLLPTQMVSLKKKQSKTEL